MYKKRYSSNNIRGKLKVCRYLKKNKKLKQYVPKTVSFSRSKLKMMMKRYKMLYVKPDIGSMGIGVCKLKKSSSSYDLYQIKKKKQVHKNFHSLSDVYKRLKASENPHLIIQKGISLDHVNNGRYDIRAMVQRRPGGTWKFNGLFAKVGKPQKIVNNFYQGGKVYTMQKLGKMQGISASQTSSRIKKLKRTALEIAKTLSKKRSGMHEMGVDFALDKNQKLWVLEVNTNHPQFYPIKNIDRSAYKKMKKFARSYGRKDT